MQRRAVAALTVVSDAILRAAFELRLGVIDLRSVCGTRADYANPIEASVQGSSKIARAIARSLTAPAPTGWSRVFG